MIVIRALINSIARLVGVEPNTDDRVAGSERLNMGAFEQMKFFKIDGGHICWIYPDNRLIPLPNVYRTSFLNWVNLYFLSSADELARPAPPPHSRASSSLQPSTSHDYPNLHATVRSI